MLILCFRVESDDEPFIDNASIATVVSSNVHERSASSGTSCDSAAASVASCDKMRILFQFGEFLCTLKDTVAYHVLFARFVFIFPGFYAYGRNVATFLSCGLG